LDTIANGTYYTNLKADPHSEAEGITDTQLSDRQDFGPLTSDTQHVVILHTVRIIMTGVGTMLASIRYRIFCLPVC